MGCPCSKATRVYNVDIEYAARKMEPRDAGVAGGTKASETNESSTTPLGTAGLNATTVEDPATQNNVANGQECLPGAMKLQRSNSELQLREKENADAGLKRSHTDVTDAHKARRSKSIDGLGMGDANADANAASATEAMTESNIKKSTSTNTVNGRKSLRGSRATLNQRGGDILLIDKEEYEPVTQGMKKSTSMKLNEPIAAYQRDALYEIKKQMNAFEVKTGYVFVDPTLKRTSSFEKIQQQNNPDSPSFTEEDTTIITLTSEAKTHTSAVAIQTTPIAEAVVAVLRKSSSNSSVLSSPDGSHKAIVIENAPPIEPAFPVAIKKSTSNVSLSKQASAPVESAPAKGPAPTSIKGSNTILVTKSQDKLASTTNEGVIPKSMSKASLVKFADDATSPAKKSASTSSLNKTANANTNSSQDNLHRSAAAAQEIKGSRGSLAKVRASREQLATLTEATEIKVSKEITIEPTVAKKELSSNQSLSRKSLAKSLSASNVAAKPAENAIKKSSSRQSVTRSRVASTHDVAGENLKSRQASNSNLEHDEKVKSRQASLSNLKIEDKPKSRQGSSINVNLKTNEDADNNASGPRAASRLSINKSRTSSKDNLKQDSHEANASRAASRASLTNKSRQHSEANLVKSASKASISKSLRNSKNDLLENETPVKLVSKSTSKHSLKASASQHSITKRQAETATSAELVKSVSKSASKPLSKASASQHSIDKQYVSTVRQSASRGSLRNVNKSKSLEHLKLEMTNVSEKSALGVPVPSQQGNII